MSHWTWEYVPDAASVVGGLAERFGERPTAPLGTAGELGPDGLGQCLGLGGRGHRG